MPSMSSDIGGFGEFGELWVWPRHCFWLTSTFVIIRDLPLTWFLLWNHDKPMSLKFRLLGFLSRNTLSRKHDVGVLFTWAKVYFQRRAVVPVKTYLKERTRCTWCELAASERCNRTTAACMTAWWHLTIQRRDRPSTVQGYRVAQKNGATGHLISLQIFRKLHDRFALKLLDFCNIICWTQSLIFFV